MNQDEEIVKLKKTVALMRKRLDTHDKLHNILNGKIAQYDTMCELTIKSLKLMQKHIADTEIKP